MEKNSKTNRCGIQQDLLPFVEKPGRYIGGEVNSCRKDFDACDVRFGICFPDTYEIGMSNTGVSLIYELLNRLEWAGCERFFTPWTDAIEIMREKGIELFSLESKTPAKEFDMLGFSITTELCHTNILAMLDLAGLELRSKNRGENDPIILGGGQIANCCEPMADFFDIFILGDCEDALPAQLELLRESKSQGISKEDFLLEAGRRFSWAYVPRLYEPSEKGGITPAKSGLPAKLENAAVKDFENACIPEKPIVPFVEAVHERVSVEIMRGCPNACRFCQANFTKRPVRLRSVERVFNAAVKSYEATGFDSVSLLSLSTADYPWLEKLSERLNEYFAPRKVGISLPSLRVEKQLELIPALGAAVRKSGLTIAVEAASERLRRLINKPITNEKLFAGLKEAYKAGYQRVKLYFMAGFPGETEQDLREIADLAGEVSRLAKQITGKTASVNAAVSWLVPKPHTPFQWQGQKSGEYFENAKQIILSRKKELGLGRKVSFKFHDISQSILETVLARGTRELGGVIEDVYRAGGMFDLWHEHFRFDIWQEKFAQSGIDYQRIAQSDYQLEDVLPWEHLGGPDRELLLRHWEKALDIISSEGQPQSGERSEECLERKV
ncbi:(Dimethylallyl)adenosine tRNA methylthiotransferase MiaB [Sedimentisphaera cyanobacteriorum]|uniref:(Dimethylallyl)adenosine tRNA methylthiotransferase MiaB n=1 Tax=Sedimentisphaera cyanobacteriorum TaxID=1940790 RepID=A0A1Q2HRW3_9BACT|nr:TIGR03960 family B12-binding radical SAM protein [Sedimentisphaera cyanobacteriorum]AQQ09975.1 (Dimethylallyl)adenosine tRNA methylthiotransferase MiaB [Sedimentisphaera cyanobacteriorum]